jgi:hypothetical protein
MDVTTLTLGFLVESLILVHENEEDLGAEYNNTKELFLKISDVILDPHTKNAEDIAGQVLDNKPLESFLKNEKSKSWIKYIAELFDYLKQKIETLIESLKFKQRPSSFQ